MCGRVGRPSGGGGEEKRVAGVCVKREEKYAMTLHYLLNVNHVLLYNYILKK